MDFVKSRHHFFTKKSRNSVRYNCSCGDFADGKLFRNIGQTMGIRPADLFQFGIGQQVQ
jgi:hypothetical protein